MPVDPSSHGPLLAGPGHDPWAAAGEPARSEPGETTAAADGAWGRPRPGDPSGERTERQPGDAVDGAFTAPGDPSVEPFPGIPRTQTEPAAGAAPSGGRGRRGRVVRRVGAVVGVLALAGVVFTGGVAADRSGLLGGPAAVPAPKDAAQFAVVEQAWNLLRTQYVRASDVDPTTMAYGAITGMTQAIGDTGHTTFLSPADRKASAAELSGTYVGIGVELDINDSGIPVITGLIHGGPSEAAGILPGDEIIAVDGSATHNVALETIASRIRGATGTKVTLTIQRPGETSTRTFTIVRSEITLPPVDSAMIPGTTIGMIRVEQFSTGAGDQFATQLKALLAKHPTGLILDLRGDPGGYTSEATSIASQFLTSGDVYITRDASGKETAVPVKPGALAPTIPLVVLVDNGTASSAEIVAGALQDAGRAQIVGTTTFGTGTVVAEYPLKDGSALRIGTIEWLTPKHQQIWHHGISPNVTVELAQGVLLVTPNDLASLGASGIASTKDAQLTKAITLIESGAATPSPAPSPPTAPSPSASPSS
jgi:carboxyl-terminal processing protease